VDLLRTIESHQGYYLNDYFATYYILLMTKMRLLKANKSINDIDFSKQFFLLEDALKYVGESTTDMLEFTIVSELTYALAELNQGGSDLWDILLSLYQEHWQQITVRETARFVEGYVKSGRNIGSLQGITIQIERVLQAPNHIDFDDKTHLMCVLIVLSKKQL